MPLPYSKDEMKNITFKVYALYTKYGIDGISMDEISRRTNISKATIYKYFTSKEEIVRNIVGILINHLTSPELDLSDGIDGLIRSVTSFYEKSIMIMIYSGSAFLDDLKDKFPEMYDDYRSASESFLKQFADFYRQAVASGYCKTLLPVFVVQQFQRMLPLLTDTEYLNAHDLSLEKSIKEYYRIFLCQILSEKYLFIADDEKTYQFVYELVDTLKKTLLADDMK